MDILHDKDNVVISPLTSNLSENIDTFEALLVNCSDVIKRKFTIGNKNKVDIYISYIDNMIDKILLEQDTIRNLLNNMEDLPETNQFEFIRDNGLQTTDIKEIITMDDVTQTVLSGDCVIMVDGYEKALVIAIKGYPGRGVPAVEAEVTIKGSKDSFTESIAVNKVLIRRRIRDTQLKVEPLKVGIRSRTDLSILYVSGIAKTELVDEIKRRINSFTIDGIFDIGMLEQLTETSWYSPFPQFQSTERPDKTASALLEGRVVILVDNSPMALLLPATLNSFFQASDDYYNRWEVVSFIRVLRYIAAMLAIGLPGLYIAITNYQPELIPTSLALSFAAAREGVPFSIVLEIIIMELAFELLSEAGVRLPAPMGNTIGIVGGLIIGDAAVSANLVSPMVVIVVAFTAIASFSIPNETFSSAFRITRYLIIILSAWLGLYGYILGMMLVLMHLAGLKSFGVPYLSPFVANGTEKGSAIYDTILKFPIFDLKKRPIYSNPEEKIKYVDKKHKNMK